MKANNLNEGILDTIKNIFRNDSSGPETFGAKGDAKSIEFVNTFKRDLYIYLNSGIRGGLVNVESNKVPGDETPAPPPPPTPTPTTESRYHKLNVLFEQIIAEVDEVDKRDSIATFIFKFLAKEHQEERLTVPASVFSMFVPAAKEAQEAWQAKNKKGVDDAITKIAYAWYSIVQQAPKQRGAGGGGVSKANPQEKYTGALTRQIERMGKEYSDDIPIIIHAFLKQLKEINPSGGTPDAPGFREVINAIKNDQLDELITAMRPSGEGGATTESKIPKKAIHKTKR